MPKSRWQQVGLVAALVSCAACASDANSKTDTAHEVSPRAPDLASDGGTLPAADAASAQAAPRKARSNDAKAKPDDAGKAQPDDASAQPDDASAQPEDTTGSAGDPERGRTLLLNNGTEAAPYLSCGIPKSLVESLQQLGVNALGDNPRMPERVRGNAELPYNFSYAKTRAGVEVVSANCLMCHASQLGGSLVVGLGNPNMDFTRPTAGFLGLPDIAEDLLRLLLDPKDSVELDRFLRLSRAGTEMGRPDTVGLNPADAVFAVLAAHRDADTLAWRDEADPEADLGLDLVFTDVPAWWNMQRRGRMFYNGFGHGSHARIMMTAALMCLEDVAEAAAIDAYFPDIEAYIKSLQPPRYEDVAQRSIDAERAERGAVLYADHCTSCHGNADEPPLEEVPVDEVGTDPAYAIAASVHGQGAVAYYFSFFNRSWYGQHGQGAQLARTEVPSYSAPPLVGVWATAPYFHNASVPTLAGVLYSTLRPDVFRRSVDPAQYDFESVGWPYEEVDSKGEDTSVYDATRPKYQNIGHTFTDALTDDERRDLLEYLKTL
jgi:mono/diheme cytochrome c family protein